MDTRSRINRIYSFNKEFSICIACIDFILYFVLIQFYITMYGKNLLPNSKQTTSLTPIKFRHVNFDFELIGIAIATTIRNSYADL